MVLPGSLDLFLPALGTQSWKSLELLLPSHSWEKRSPVFQETHQVQKRQPAKPAPLPRGSPSLPCPPARPLQAAEQAGRTAQQHQNDPSYNKQKVHESFGASSPQGVANSDEKGGRNCPGCSGKQWSRAGRWDQQEPSLPEPQQHISARRNCHRPPLHRDCSPLPAALLSPPSSPPPPPASPVRSLPSSPAVCIQAKLMKAKRFPSCYLPSASWDFRSQLKVLWSRLQTHLQCSGIFALIILISFILLCFL